jgi:RimJ/RimL family protein N-acetyltransferase
MKISAQAKICNDDYLLRTIKENDLEILRLWKNAHKEYFFYKIEITPEEQSVWFEALNERRDDHMFIIEVQGKGIGCIGARKYQEFIDIYNVILGDKNYKGQHVMTNALWAVVSFCNLVFIDKPVRVRVLRTNPAIKWYEKIGFKMIDYYEDHVVMQFMNSYLKGKHQFNIDLLLPLQ